MKRFAALLSLLAFVSAGTAEGTGVHRCPHHDGPPPATDHAAHHANGADHGPGDNASASHEGCTCMGACQPGGAATPVEDSASVTHAPDDHAPAGWWAPPAPRVAHHPFELPPANGPPTD